MGMYTKVNLILPIKKETDNNILKLLNYMITCCYDFENFEQAGIKLPEHPFFEKGNRIWAAKSNSYYFTGTSNSTIQFDTLKEYAMVIHIDMDFKNYNDEINKFLDWITPYLDCSEDQFLGYSQYECDDNPTAYFYQLGKINSFDMKCI